MAPRPDRARAQASRNAPNMAPVLGFVVLAVVAIGFAGWLYGKKNEAEAARAEETPELERRDPFADVPDEEPPVRGGPASPFKTTERAPEGLELVAIWVEAKKIADVGYALAQEAELAKAADDLDTFNARGAAARESFDDALERTAEWELEIEELYGETDRQVRRIKRERSKWFDMLRKYRKAGSDD